MTFAAAGNYNVIATLTTDSGCVTTQLLSTTIYPKPSVLFNLNNVCNTDSIQITNLSNIASGIMNYYWRFGNTKTSTLFSPKTKYSIANTYSVDLIATSNNGCKDSLTKSITVYDAPNTSFTFTNACDGKPVMFTNNTSVVYGSISNYNWLFGDNSNSAQATPLKTYATFGTYTVSLEATSSNACKSTLTKTVSVYEGAKADFSFTNKCVNHAIPFVNYTTLSNGTYNSFWAFGDNTTSVVNSPSHQYQTAGTKTVTLKATTNNGCKDSVTKQIQAFALPIVNAGNDTLVSKGFSANLKATGGEFYSWFPSLGLNNPIIKNPIATPNETTYYVVEATNLNGCVNSDTMLITVSDDFLVIPYNIVTPDGNNKNDTWIVQNIESYPNNTVTLLDEWGVIIFEQQAYDNSWDGRNKQGNILPDGTYYYLLTLNDNHKTYKGFIALLRNK